MSKGFTFRGQTQEAIGLTNGYSRISPSNHIVNDYIGCGFEKTINTDKSDMKAHLLLLHGALGSENQFKSLIPDLEAHFVVHSMSFDGHGGHSTDEPFSMNMFARNVLDKMENAGLDKTHIFGYSMGGYVALNLALNHSDSIGDIVTLGTKFDWNKDSAAREVKMLNPEKIEEKVPQFAQKLRQEHAPADWKEVLHKTAAMMLDLGENAALKDSDFNRIKNKVTIGIGSRDNMVGISESEWASGQLPNGKLQVLENVVHPIEKVDSKVLANFIQESLI